MTNSQIQDWEIECILTRSKNDLLHWLNEEMIIQKRKNKKIIKRLDLSKILTL